MKAFTIILLIALLSAAPHRLHASILHFKSIANIKAILFQRPDTRPQVVVEIIGADLNHRANRFFDRWSRPDVYILLHHGSVDRETQVEGNTDEPRFLFKTKMPFFKTMGLRFVVKEADVLQGDSVIGRAFIDTGRIKELMDSEESALLSLGEDIGILKIRVTKLPPELSHSSLLCLNPKKKKLHELSD
eukprot:CAMPEP_0196130798 /NCGR_PEP_ID=MMETSP0910-20130528/1052_1 /TAXON_ID=49265 /ORGANISM="Thalassiosira rotula, Strain GSO102" /LENGTH=188 /DNA_ID=CAMNT_0041390173 /DNA_START=172 /DNA_END=738 /DNA_ORIENTATION=-